MFITNLKLLYIYIKIIILIDIKIYRGGIAFINEGRELINYKRGSIKVSNKFIDITFYIIELSRLSYNRT